MIKIYTLGDFDIQIDDVSILQSIGNQPRLMKLFKYFLTFQGKKLLPENIIEDIWKEDNFKDPLNVLRTQISRVRNMIDFEKYKKEPFFDIIYIDGYYLFKLHNNCIVDFLVMQSCIEKYNTLKDREDVMEACKQGIELYKGEYLGELGLEDWLIPIRNRFDRLYVNSLSQYLQSLKGMSMDNHIVSICEEAMSYKPYEDIIHIYFIESLLNLGQTRYALNHYKYFTTKMYNELGISPSNKLKELYKKIKSKEDKSSIIVNLTTLDGELRDYDNFEGALLCDKHCFQLLYNLELRFNERNKRDAFVGIITIDKSGHRQFVQREMEGAMSILLDIVYHRLRKGDVINQWNENQLLLLLFSLKEVDLEEIIDRIKKNFNDLIKNDKMSLNIKFKNI